MNENNYSGFDGFKIFNDDVHFNNKLVSRFCGILPNEEIELRKLEYKWSIL